MAWPRVITPRTSGQPIHLCFSERRSRGSEWVTIVPLGWRTAMPQAWGERIMTPSRTAWPPTRVSSPLSSAGSNCTAARKRKKFLTLCILMSLDDSGDPLGSQYRLYVKGYFILIRPCLQSRKLWSQCGLGSYKSETGRQRAMEALQLRSRPGAAGLQQSITDRSRRAAHKHFYFNV